MSNNYKNPEQTDKIGEDNLGEDKKTGKKAGNKKSSAGFKDVSGLGLSMIFCVLIGFFLGQYLDKIFGTQPVFFIVFIFMGIAAAFMQIYKLVKRG